MELQKTQCDRKNVQSIIRKPIGRLVFCHKCFGHSHTVNKLPLKVDKLPSITFRVRGKHSNKLDREILSSLPCRLCEATTGRRHTMTMSRGACRATRATESRCRLPVGVRALTELGFVSAFQAMSLPS
jgi:hypothetical protein